MLYDTLIRNALIIDGSNSPGYTADVAILNGRIERIGDLQHDSANEEIDAAGRVLAPGFIDVLATELALANPEDNQERLRRIKLALDDYRGGDDHLPLGD